MSSVHNEELVLLSYLDGELDAGESAEVRRHLDTCEECRFFVDDAGRTLRWHAEEVRASLPPPPKPWADLQVRIDDLDAEQLQTHRPRPRFQHAWWAAAAAGVAIAAMVLRLGTSTTVNAAELLEKASVKDAPVARLYVRTSKGSFVRTANDSGDPAIAAMFRNARFDWDQPLRAGAFADWRNGLSNKRDEVRILQNPLARDGRYYRVTTSTPEGTLSEVSVMIRASDLRAVEERFQFRNNEWVEISEAVEVPSSPEQPPSLDALSTTTGEGPTIADEIMAIEALHRIGADLGEPIEVRRGESAVDVIVLGAAPQREREVRDALAGLPHVSVRFEQPQAVRAPATDRPTRAVESPTGALQARLLQLMGSSANADAFTNAALETSESIVARAHAIRNLKERFADSNETVGRMVANHRRAVRAAVTQLEETLQPLTGEIEPAARQGNVDARALLGSAQRLDTLLSLALVAPNSSDNADDVLARLRRAFAELQSITAELEP